MVWKIGLRVILQRYWRIKEDLAKDLKKANIKKKKRTSAKPKIKKERKGIRDIVLVQILNNVNILINYEVTYVMVLINYDKIILKRCRSDG